MTQPYSVVWENNQVSNDLAEIWQLICDVFSRILRGNKQQGLRKLYKINQESSRGSFCWWACIMKCFHPPINIFEERYCDNHQEPPEPISADLKSGKSHDDPSAAVLLLVLKLILPSSIHKFHSCLSILKPYFHKVVQFRWGYDDTVHDNQACVSNLTHLAPLYSAVGIFLWPVSGWRSAAPS